MIEISESLDIDCIAALRLAACDSDLDDFDSVSYHQVMKQNGVPIGCARLRIKEQVVTVDKIAVLAEYQSCKELLSCSMLAKAVRLLPKKIIVWDRGAWYFNMGFQVNQDGSLSAQQVTFGCGEKKGDSL